MAWTPALLAVSDYGFPAYQHDLAAEVSALGAVAFGCTPDKFPELMAATLNHKDLRQWAGQNDLKVTQPKSIHSEKS